MKEQIIKMLQDGSPYCEISETVGCSKSTVAYHARKSGLSKGKPLRHYDWPAIQAFYDEGHSGRACMRRFGCSVSVWDRAKNQGRIKVRPAVVYTDSTCRCRFCGREYIHRKGHTRSKCNSCMTNRRRFAIKQRAVDRMGGKCQVCGYDRCLAALTFHHLDPAKKTFVISGAHARAWTKIQDELEKCVLLCSNCHHEAHAGLIDVAALAAVPA